MIREAPLNGRDGLTAAASLINLVIDLAALGPVRCQTSKGSPMTTKSPCIRWIGAICTLEPRIADRGLKVPWKVSRDSVYIHVYDLLHEGVSAQETHTTGQEDVILTLRNPA